MRARKYFSQDNSVQKLTEILFLIYYGEILNAM